MKNTIKRIGMIFAVVIMTVSLFSIISTAVSYPGHEHHYITFHGAVEATGCTDGKTGRAYCEACSIWIGESVIIPAPHYPSEWEIVGTVTDCRYGYLMEKKCTQCGTIIETKTGNLHSWGEDPDADWKVIQEPTCTVDGICRRGCEYCLRVEEKLITATGHKYRIKFSGIAPTCTEEGRTAVRACENCGDVLGGVILGKLPHKDDNSDYFCDRCEELMPGTSFTEGYYSYTIKKDGATIINVDKSISGEVVIPSTLGGYPVTAIGDEAFIDCMYMTSVTIPEGVTSIGSGAFLHCVSLTEFSLPHSLKHIDDIAFAYCLSLTDIDIPDTVNHIGAGAFGGCYILKEVNVPENVEILYDCIFMYCFSLEKLIINNTETNFDKYYICCTDHELVNITADELAKKLKEIYFLEYSGKLEEAEELYTDITNNNIVYTENMELIKTVTIYSHDPSTAKTYAEENGIPFKNISELEEPHTCSYGEWFTETEPTLFSEGVSKRACDCGRFETKPIAKLQSAVTKDETTNVEITYTEENFETEVSVIVSEETINANIVFGDEFENYKAYDISIVADGKKVQPDGTVTVKLPLPEGFNAETTAVYYVDDNGNKTKLESKVENGFVVFETDHFSEYVLVDESSKIKPSHEHSYAEAITKTATCTEAGVKTYTCTCGDTYTEEIAATGHDFDGSECNNCDYDKADDCSCNCHAGGIKAFFFKLINFFEKIFGINKVCACGVAHY